MAWVRNSQGVIGQVPDAQLQKALKSGYTAVTDEELQTAKTDQAAKDEAGSHPIQTALENVIPGAVDMFGAPARAAGGLLEAGIGQNPVSDTLGQITGENLKGAVSSIANDPGAILGMAKQTQPENDAAVQQELSQMHGRSQANPVSNFAGNFAGGLVGMAPVAGIGAAAGGATESALGGGTVAHQVGNVAEGAAFGSTVALAEAEDEAHRQQSALKGSQALAAVGIGGIIGGFTNFFGKGAAELFEKRAAAEAASTGLGAEAVPDLQPGEKTTPLNVHAESDIYHEIPALEVPTKTRPGMPTTTYEAESVPSVPELEAPVGLPSGRHARGRTDLDMSMSEDMTPVGGNRIRYSPGQRDLVPAGAGEHDLPLGGLGAQETNPEELRAALSGEDINSRNRAAKVQKLIQPIPEGATPDWIMNMSDQERVALADYTGALTRTDSGKPIVPSDTTWQALADALAEREGFTKGPVEGVTTTQPAPLPPTYNPGAQAGQEFLANQPAVRATPAPEPVQAAATVPGSRPLPPQPEEGKAGWLNFLGKVVKMGARREAFHIGAGLVGGSMWGPAGYAAGYAASHLGGMAFDRMGGLAAKSASLAGKTLGYAFRTAATVPQPIKLGTDAYLIKKATDFYMGKQKTPEAAFQAKVKELQALNADGGALMTQKVGNAFGHLADKEMGALTAVTQSVQTGVAYLLQKAPGQAPDSTSLTPLASKPVPSRIDLNDFERTYNAVMYPTTVLADIKTGLVTSGQIDAIKTVHPQWYQESIIKPALDIARTRDAANSPFTPQERRLMDTILAIHSGVEDDKYADHYSPLFQKAVAAQAQPAPQQQDQSSGRKLGKRSVISSSYLTQTSRMLGVSQT